MTDAKTTDPLFAGLNDKSITAIPASVEKQRYVTSVAPKAANPGKTATNTTSGKTIADRGAGRTSGRAGGIAVSPKPSRPRVRR